MRKPRTIDELYREVSKQLRYQARKLKRQQHKLALVRRQEEVK